MLISSAPSLHGGDGVRRDYEAGLLGARAVQVHTIDAFSDDPVSAIRDLTGGGGAMRVPRGP